MIVAAVRRTLDQLDRKPSTDQLVEAALVILDRINTGDLREMSALHWEDVANDLRAGAWIGCLEQQATEIAAIEDDESQTADQLRAHLSSARTGLLMAHEDLRSWYRDVADTIDEIGAERAKLDDTTEKLGELEDRLENMSIPSVEVGEVLERIGLIGSGAKHNIDRVREGWAQLVYLLDRAPVPRLTR